MSGWLKLFWGYDMDKKEKDTKTTTGEFKCDDFTGEIIDFAGYRLWINRYFSDRFKMLSDYILQKGYDQHIKRVDGFNCRRMRTVSWAWSYHSYGQAIDVNPDQFPMTKISEKYILPAWFNDLIDYAISLGFRSGRDWSSVYDPMHLEIGIPIRRDI